MSKALFDVDFSLAMHNRTGKYFIGRDLLDCASDLLGRTYYWRLITAAPPRSLAAKIVCRLQGAQIALNTRGGLFGHAWRPTPARPLLHLEPFTVLGSALRREDAVVIHDIGPVTHPELFDPALHRTYELTFAEIAATGPHLVFVSIASRRAFETRYPHCRSASVHVCYPAIRTGVGSGVQKPVGGIGGRFLLTTGSFGDRKNQARSIGGFARSGLADRGVTYVLCGAREPGHEKVAEAARRTPGVVLLPYVSNAQLTWLYAHASGFVLASLLEGFGMPLAEAIAHGAVPLVTADSVLEEVAGDAALTCNALSEDSIAAGMRLLIDMPDAERASRLVELHAAMARFAPNAFCAQWRAALTAMSQVAG